MVAKSVGDAAISDPGSMSVFRSDTGQVKRVVLTGSSGGVVWGSGFYTDDTGLATAAVHAGVLQLGETGTVAVWIGPGQSVYRATLQNGVASSSYGSFPGSYAFLARVPHITAQPTPRAVWAGDSAAFAVQASGSGALGYQWRRDGVDLAGATASTVTVAYVGAGEVGVYDVVITDSEGCVVSAQAEIPFAQAVCAGWGGRSREQCWRRVCFSCDRFGFRAALGHVVLHHGFVGWKGRRPWRVADAGRNRDAGGDHFGGTKQLPGIDA